MENSSRLKGRVAVITGSTRGIGLIIAKSLAAAGANVVICSRSESRVTATAQQLNHSSNAGVLGVVYNVSDLNQVEELAEKTLEHFGKIDIWFNNAALNRYFGPVFDVPVTHWQEVINTNLNGTFHGTYVALKHMLSGAEKFFGTEVLSESGFCLIQVSMCYSGSLHEMLDFPHSRNSHASRPSP